MERLLLIEDGHAAYLRRAISIGWLISSWKHFHMRVSVSACCAFVSANLYKLRALPEVEVAG